MILGTHNSLSFSRPRKWYMWFYKPFGRCQKKTLEEQYKAGARCFDIRIRFTENGNPIFAHGLYEVKFTDTSLFNFLNNISEKVYLRVILETRKKDRANEADFNEFFNFVVEEFPNVFVFGGYRKFDWEQVSYYILNEANGNPNKKYRLIQNVGSMAKDARWYERLMPFTYARRMNRKNMKKKYGLEDIVIYDFL